MTTVDNWQAINRDLVQICQTLCDRLAGRLNSNVAARISHGFALKAMRTLKSIVILYDNGLPEQAQALVRILLELRLNFDCFLSMLANDYRSTCARVIDSMMLEKIKQARASDFAGHELIPGSPSPQDLEAIEKEINSRYSPSDLERLKKYGFTGVSVEERAKLTGHEEIYNIVYRNFSRNVHSTDYVEQYMQQGFVAEERMRDYYQSRDNVSMYTAHFAAGGIAEFANHAFDCDLHAELDAIGRRQQALRSRQSV